MMLGIDDSDLEIPIFSVVCTRCKHVKNKRACAAFGDVLIPLPIWMGDNDHTSPYPGDNGITFEQVAAGASA